MFKKLSIGLLAGTLVYFAFGWFVFDFLLGSYTELNTTNISGFKKTGGQYSLLLLIISCMAYTALINFILIFLLNNKNILKGFIISSITGLLVAIMTDTYWYATSTFYLNMYVVIFDIAAAAITVGALGLAVTWVNKIMSKK